MEQKQSRCESWGLSTLIKQSQWNKHVQKMLEKSYQSLNQGPPALTPYALTTQPLPPFAAHCTLFLLYKWILELN